ncbi:MAG: hypothetical protein ND866_09115 [Pyrinomonadaceae bacterium]|nr:hypothetical protein [Pyrinomonadaceae bacterium]
MCKMFIRRFVASILVLLIASSVLLTNGQSQSGVLSDEDEAEILESLIQSEIKPLGSEFGSIRIFSSDNIGLVLATRIAKHGFSLMAAREIERLKQEYLVDYVVIRSISLRNGICGCQVVHCDGRSWVLRYWGLRGIILHLLVQKKPNGMGRQVGKEARTIPFCQEFGDHTLNRQRNPTTSACS